MSLIQIFWNGWPNQSIYPKLCLIWSKSRKTGHIHVNCLVLWNSEAEDNFEIMRVCMWSKLCLIWSNSWKTSYVHVHCSEFSNSEAEDNFEIVRVCMDNRRFMWHCILNCDYNRLEIEVYKAAVNSKGWIVLRSVTSDYIQNMICWQQAWVTYIYWHSMSLRKVKYSGTRWFVSTSWDVEGDSGHVT